MYTYNMKTRINSGKEAELSLEQDGLHMIFMKQDLDTLLQQVTPRNIHREVRTGATTGKEL